MVTPALRNASSRSRCASVSKLNSVVSKICGVGLERDLGAALLGRAGDDQIGLRRAALVGLLIDLLVAPDLELEPLGERVDDRHADAVQTAGHLVAVVVELAAGVQHGQHDLGRRPAALVHVGRNAAAVVDDRDRVVDVDGDVDLGGEPGQRFVDRVVDDLVDEMMQPGRPGRPDVHRRPLAHRLEAFEDLDALCAVLVGARAVGDVSSVDTRFHSVTIGQDQTGRDDGLPSPLHVLQRARATRASVPCHHTRIGMIT